MRKKAVIFLLILYVSYFCYSQNMRFIPSFLFSSGYSYSDINKSSIFYKSMSKDIKSHEFYTRLDGTLQVLIPRTILNLDYTLSWSLNNKISININRCWAKFSLGDYAALQIGRYYMNWNEGLKWNVSDFINNKKKWHSSGTVSGKDGIDININLPFNYIPMNLNIATLYFNDIKDLSLFFLIGAMVYPVDLKLKCAVYYDKPPALGFAIHSNFGNIKISLDSALLFNQGIKEDYGFNDSKCQFRFTGQGTYYLPITNNSELSFLLSYLFQSDGLTGHEGTKFIEDTGLAFENNQLETYINNSKLIMGNYFRNYRQYINSGVSYSYKDLFNAGINLNLNMEDYSGAVAAECSYNLLHTINLESSATVLFGKKNTEIGNMPYNYILSLAISKK